MNTTANNLQKVELKELTQRTDEIAQTLVPDCVVLSSDDKETRELFRKRHRQYYERLQEMNREFDTDYTKLAKWYDLESLALHHLLSEELYYYWSDDRAARCLDRVRDTYPEATAEQLREIYEKYQTAVTEIYG